MKGPRYSFKDWERFPEHPEAEPREELEGDEDDEMDQQHDAKSKGE
jgi:hypothetical protein